LHRRRQGERGRSGGAGEARRGERHGRRGRGCGALDSRGASPGDDQGAGRFTLAGRGPVTDTILVNGRIATLDPARPTATALAVEDGFFAAVGSDREVMAAREPTTIVLDLGGRSVIPGLNDSHTHLIRGGLNYNQEVPWER